MNTETCSELNPWRSPESNNMPRDVAPRQMVEISFSLAKNKYTALVPAILVDWRKVDKYRPYIEEHNGEPVYILVDAGDLPKWCEWICGAPDTDLLSMDEEPVRNTTDVGVPWEQRGIYGWHSMEHYRIPDSKPWKARVIR